MVRGKCTASHFTPNTAFGSIEYCVWYKYQQDLCGQVALGFLTDSEGGVEMGIMSASGVGMDNGKVECEKEGKRIEK